MESEVHSSIQRFLVSGHNAKTNNQKYCFVFYSSSQSTGLQVKFTIYINKDIIAYYRKRKYFLFNIQMHYLES